MENQTRYLSKLYQRYYNPTTFEIFSTVLLFKEYNFYQTLKSHNKFFHCKKFYPWTKIFDTRAAWKHHNDNNDDDYDDNDDDDDDNDED